MLYNNCIINQNVMLTIIYFSVIITMNYIEVNYQTWEREECYGLFDYSETKNIRNHESLPVKTSGLLLRNEGTFDLRFIESNAAKKSKIDNHIPFIKIEQTSGHYFIEDKIDPENNQPLCLIVSRSEKGYCIKERDKIRLGKATLEILNINWKKKRTKNHYEEISTPTIAERHSLFASSFYSEFEKASMLETNPSCRLCYGKTIEASNPFLAVCSCAGSTKYIHQACLIQWIQKRSGILEDSGVQGVYCCLAKAFYCEVCHSPYRVERIIKKIFNVSGGELQSYIAIQVNTDPAYVHVIDLSVVDNITIGRSLENSVVVNQLSVSRKHCFIRIDKDKNLMRLVDLGAKFGTVVQMKKGEIEDEQDYQKGRTKIRLRVVRKMSFFQRLGFCSAKQQLRNEGHRK